MRQSTFDKRLKLLITYHGITQKELSTQAGIREQTISNYITAQRDPKTSILIKISETFNVSPSWLLGYGTDEDMTTLQNQEVKYGNF